MNNIIRKIEDRLGELSIEPTGRENIDQGERLLSVLAGSWLLYKSVKGIGRRPLRALTGTAAAGLLLYRGATGVCPVYERIGKDTTDPEAITIVEDIVVNAPRQSVYRFWRELSNLPRFMQHLKSVEETTATRSNWVANTPGGLIDLKWTAEVTREEEDEYIGWHSVSGSMIDNAGKVEFKDTLNGIGTELHIEIEYFPPAGSVGRGLASLFTGVFEDLIRKDIQGFKDYAEAEDFKAYAGVTEL